MKWFFMAAVTFILATGCNTAQSKQVQTADQQVQQRTVTASAAVKTVAAKIKKGDQVCLDQVCGQDFPKPSWWRGDFMIEVRSYSGNGGPTLYKAKVLYSVEGDGNIHHAECSPKLTSRDAVYDHLFMRGYVFTISQRSMSYAYVKEVPRDIFLKRGP